VGINKFIMIISTGTINNRNAMKNHNAPWQFLHKRNINPSTI
jgi:hypothetical protein